MGLGIGEEPVWCPPTMEHSVGEQNRLIEEKQNKTQKTIPWTMVGSGGEPKWASSVRSAHAVTLRNDSPF